MDDTGLNSLSSPIARKSPGPHFRLTTRYGDDPLVEPGPGPLSVREETANQLTHGAGFLLSLYGGWLLVTAAQTGGNPLQILGCVVYAVSLSLLYASSTLSHSFQHYRLRDAFRTLDQVCIFLLIAGSYTPVGLTWCHEGWLHGVLISMWAFSTVGILMKLFVARRDNVAVWFYAFVGWLPLLAFGRLYECLETAGFVWMLAGAVSYSCGVYFLINDQRVRYFHAVWHVLTIGGSFCHYMVIYRYTVLATA